MNLVAYIRVSTDGQVDAYGPDAQERTIRAWAKVHKHRLVTIYSESVSGALPVEERPVLKEALGALQPAPRPVGLVVACLDRLARTLTVQEECLMAAWRLGATVYSVDGPDGGEVLADDPSDPMRTAMRQMRGVFAQLDRAMVVKRMRDGKTAKAAAGRHAEGIYPFGYTGKGAGKERDKAPDPSERGTLDRMLELRREGASYRQIATALDAEGLRPRRAARWSSMSVRNIVERELASA